MLLLVLLVLLCIASTMAFVPAAYSFRSTNQPSFLATQRSRPLFITGTRIQPASAKRFPPDSIRIDQVQALTNNLQVAVQELKLERGFSFQAVQKWFTAKYLQVTTPIMSNVFRAAFQRLPHWLLLAIARDIMETYDEQTVREVLHQKQIMIQPPLFFRQMAVRRAKSLFFHLPENVQVSMIKAVIATKHNSIDSIFHAAQEASTPLPKWQIAKRFIRFLHHRLTALTLTCVQKDFTSKSPKSLQTCVLKSVQDRLIK